MEQLVFFSAGGIYGPGRSVLESVSRREPKALGKEGSSNQQRRGQQKFTSRYFYRVAKRGCADVCLPHV
eukprot:1157785-Pelagomonas_calceolata.AAC.8